MPQYNAHFEVVYDDSDCADLGVTGGRAIVYGQKSFTASDDGDARLKAWRDFNKARDWQELVPEDAKMEQVTVKSLERVIEVCVPTLDGAPKNNLQKSN